MLVANYYSNKDIRLEQRPIPKIKKGECFTENNLITKRPAGGISPMFWDAVIGEQASKDYCKDELISL